MPEGGGSISIAARPDPRRGWLVIQVQAGWIEFDASLTFFSQSLISQPLADFLGVFGYARPVGGARFLVQQLTLAEQAIPDLEVSASRLLNRTGVDAVFGSNFLILFTEITLATSLMPSSVRLTFTDP